jgi:Flp pilus assembly protein TadD
MYHAFRHLNLRGVAVVLLMCSLPGCGGSDEPRTVTKNLTADDYAKYEQMVKESETQAQSEE